MTRKPLELTSTMIPRKAPPAPAEAATEPLNFKITPTMKRRFRMAAARADMKLTELLAAMLGDWERTHPVESGNGQ